MQNALKIGLTTKPRCQNIVRPPKKIINSVYPHIKFSSSHKPITISIDLDSRTAKVTGRQL